MSKQCSWCLTYFDSEVSFQIYCQEQCRVEATKHRSRQRTRAATIKRRRKSKRYCANKGCNTLLSVYNDDKVCAHCKVSDKAIDLALNNMKDFFEGWKDA